MKRKKISMQDIAERCGTTVPTVSYVLSGSENRRVRADLRERILSCAAELGYQQLERKKAPGLIALVLPQLDNIFFRRMVLSIEKTASAAGYHTVVYHTDDNPQREQLFLQVLAAEKIKGIFLVPAVNSLVTPEQLKSMRIPFVIAERPLQFDGEYDLFAMDNFDAGYQATRALTRAGHRSIGLITWETSALTLLNRPLGYVKALEEAGILYRPEYVVSGPFDEQSGYQLANRLLDQHPELDALVLAYHVQALGCVRALRERGVAIPDRLSVVIIGNPTWADMTTPAFTHVTLSSTEIGTQATQALIRKIEKRTGPDKQWVTIKGTLVEGGSVRALPALHSQLLP